MKTVLALLFICVTSLCHGQFLDKLGNKAANAVERSVERRVEKETTKSTDRVLDTIVETPKSKQKKEKKKKKIKKSSSGNVIGGDPVDEDSKTTNTQNIDATQEEGDEN